MGLRRYYRQFEGLSEEEVNRGLREKAREERGRALARVEPLDLARTTWHGLPPAEVVAAITFHARKGLNRYAEGREADLRAALAARHAVDPARVAIGEGASGILDRAARELLAPGDELVLPWPGYPLYPLLARDAGATAVRVPSLDPQGLLDAVTPRTRVLLLGGPNDPTGELLPAGALERLLAVLPSRVVVVVDEALREFVTAEPVDAVLRLTDRTDRLVVVRSFSKAWGLAGLRCGYAVGGRGAAPLLRALAPPLGSADLSLAGALAAVRTAGDVLERRVRDVAREREGLTRELQRLGLLVGPSQSSTVWVRAPDGDGPGLHARLERSGVLVQSGSPLGDARHVRIAVRDPAARERLVRALGAPA